jgi:GH35 family endo-1,4-beta-xylanase
MEQKRTKQDSEKLHFKLEGRFLLAWNAAYKYVIDSGSKLDLNDYSIVFEESDSEYIFKFTRQFREPVLGGGVGKCIIRKKDLSIVDFKLIR